MPTKRQYVQLEYVKVPITDSSKWLL